MTRLNDLTCRLLRFEQQLKAYEKLHADEVAELWKTLNEWKRDIADAPSESASASRSRKQHAVDLNKGRTNRARAKKSNNGRRRGDISA